MGKMVVTKALLIIGLSVVIMAFGSATSTVAGSRDGMKVKGGPIDIMKTTIDQPAAVEQQDVLIQREVSKEFEAPMREPDDPRSEMIIPCRTPGCGPWKNAINHMHCAPGYDVY